MKCMFACLFSGVDPCTNRILDRGLVNDRMDCCLLFGDLLKGLFPGAYYAFTKPRTVSHLRLMSH